MALAGANSTVPAVPALIVLLVSTARLTRSPTMLMTWPTAAIGASMVTPPVAPTMYTDPFLDVTAEAMSIEPPPVPGSELSWMLPSAVMPWVSVSAPVAARLTACPAAVSETALATFKPRPSARLSVPVGATAPKATTLLPALVSVTFPAFGMPSRNASIVPPDWVMSAPAASSTVGELRLPEASARLPAVVARLSVPVPATFVGTGWVPAATTPATVSDPPLTRLKLPVVVKLPSVVMVLVPVSAAEAPLPVSVLAEIEPPSVIAPSAVRVSPADDTTPFTTMVEPVASSRRSPVPVSVPAASTLMALAVSAPAAVPVLTTSVTFRAPESTIDSALVAVKVPSCWMVLAPPSDTVAAPPVNVPAEITPVPLSLSVVVAVMVRSPVAPSEPATSIVVPLLATETTLPLTAPPAVMETLAPEMLAVVVVIVPPILARPEVDATRFCTAIGADTVMPPVPDIRTTEALLPVIPAAMASTPFRPLTAS